MFDLKKIEEYLDELLPAPSPILSPPRSALDKKMDSYDLAKTIEYDNLGTPEFPIWGKRQIDAFAYMFSGSMQMPLNYAPLTYAGINRMSFAVNGLDAAPTNPPEDKYGKIKDRIAVLAKVESSMVRRPSPDYVQTITAWRGWDAPNGNLAALGSDTVWEPKKAVKAFCRNDNHAAPQMSCECGYWSFKNLDLLTEAMKSYADSVRVIGTVEIWGRVIECENGYRSEFAYPKELWLLKDGLDSLSWTYGVPIRRI